MLELATLKQLSDDKLVEITHWQINTVRGHRRQNQR